VRLIWTELADLDLEKIEEYIGRENSLAGIDVVLGIINSVEKLLPDHPSAGRLGRVEGTQEMVVNRLPYVVVYREKRGVIEVLRVLHDSQQWPPQESS